jgi:phage tail tape-measure protein
MNLQVGDAPSRRWALCGAAAGGAVTAAIWLLLAAPLFALIGVALGSSVGAWLGMVVGSRSNARWAGDIGAAVVPAFAVAFLNGLLLLYLLTHAH